MDTIRAMRFLVRAVELGSLTAVAREFGTTQPTVGKVLGQLEAELKVRLLERSTRGPVATDQGVRFCEHARAILEQYDAAVGEAQGAAQRPTGLLRVNAPVALGQFKVNLLAQAFLRRYPDIALELTLDDRFVDLVGEGVDVALRLGASVTANVVGRHLAVVPRFLVAAPAYLAGAGTPAHPDELAAHAFVRFAWTASQAIALRRGAEHVKVRAGGRYKVNNAMAIRAALADGGGIGLCPEWLVHDLLDAGDLVRVLPDWSATSQDLYLLYPSRRYLPLRTRLFVDFIADRFAGQPGFRTPPGGAIDGGSGTADANGVDDHRARG
ncbi:LysR family transcriptional regulator [uncultured Massilia sp.]|uniref:LysR family transcriptional regulator n=1 Tax=uncultured Massilia sp. TaxID=169973 RepID=UPI0025CC40E5|nr:LysR family transcriptional regulator [uncultured Massilia sp.]